MSDTGVIACVFGFPQLFVASPYIIRFILNYKNTSDVDNEYEVYIQCLKLSQKVVGLNTLRPRQNGLHFADDIFKCIFLNENVWIPIKISLKFVPKRPVNNIPALVQIMAWRRQGDKPLSEPMMVSLMTHICVTRPQWVNALNLKSWT